MTSAVSDEPQQAYLHRNAHANSLDAINSNPSEGDISGLLPTGFIANENSAASGSAAYKVQLTGRTAN